MKKTIVYLLFTGFIFFLSCQSARYRRVSLERISGKSLSRDKTVLIQDELKNKSADNPAEMIKDMQSSLESYKNKKNSALSSLYGKDKGKRKKPKDKKIKKKKVNPCYFSAGTAIRETLKKGKKKKFITKLLGNAQVRCDKTFLYSHSINIEGKKGKTIRLRKYVKIIDTESNTILTGGYAEYFKFHKYGRILEKPKIVHRDKNTGELTTIESFSLKRDFSKKKSYCLGNVKITRGVWTAYTDKAVYDEKKDIISLVGGAIIYRLNETYSADEILIINRKPKRDGKIILQGNVRLLTYGQKEPKRLSKNNKYVSSKNNIVSIQSPSGFKKQDSGSTKELSTENPDLKTSKKISSENSLVQILITGHYFERITTKNREKTIGRGGPLHPIRIWRQTSEIHSDYFESRGKNNELIIARGNIVLWDWERNLMIKGERLVMHKNDNWGRMSLHPLVYLLSRETRRVLAKISSAEILRLFDKKELHFNGNVVLSRYEEENSVADISAQKETEQAKQSYNLEIEKKIEALSEKKASSENLEKLIDLSSKKIPEHPPVIFFNEAIRLVNDFILKQAERNPTMAIGEEAVYFEQLDFLRIQGGSSLKKGNSLLHAGKILFYPKENRIRLAGGIRASLYSEGGK